MTILTSIINIFLALLVMAFAALNAYRKMDENIQSKVSLLIAEVAEFDMIGPQKMKIVVDNLYNCVPKIFRSYMTKEKLEEIAQGIYNNMKLFVENDGKKSGSGQ